MDPNVSRYRCRACGAASYQRLTQRLPSGAMGYGGTHRCSGCAREFSDLAEWVGDEFGAPPERPARPVSEAGAPGS